MPLAHRIRELERLWNHETANLEDEILLYDFFRREEGYSPERPLVLCKDGGLLALFAMEGIDPEPLGEDDLELASAAVRRAMEVLNPANLEGAWRHGTWEVQNIFTRSEGKAPLIAAPTRSSAALRYLSDACNDYWRGKTLFHDEILWTIKFTPHFGETSFGWNSQLWKLRDRRHDVSLRLELLRGEARMMRRVLRVFEESLLGFSTRRPKMGFGLRWLGEEECLRAVWRQVNRRAHEAPPLRRDLPLLVQVASSYRDNSGGQYEIDGKPTKVMTWKVPPASSIAYLFARLQNDIRFPFTLAQNFRALDFGALAGRLGILSSFAAALGGRSREYRNEAEDFLATVRAGACPFNWYFNLLVQGETQSELEDRAAKISSLMKRIQGRDIQGGDAMEERANRFYAELATMPGNAQYGQRFNRITSRNAGDLAMVFRLSPGDAVPFLLFGDRKGGVYSYSLFSRGEPSWNKAVLGLPGSGKSMLMSAFLLGNAMFESQAYVLDKGNSYGPIFEMLEREMPSEVAVMRLRGGHFQFNPLPLVWAIGERDRRKSEGTYGLALDGGGELTCPVEDARLFFEAWLDGLVGGGTVLTPTQKNKLDRALKGPNGEGGYFRDYENQCAKYIEQHGKGRKLPPPRPLSCLLTHLRNEAPEFLPAVELWTRPPRDRFFDSGTDTVASAKYIYFELTGLDDDPLLAVPFVMALMGSIWKRVQSPALIKERKAILIDEAWSFLAHPAFFKIVEDMFRTIRKFNGFVALASQSPKDVKEGAARKLLQTMSEVWLYKGFNEPEFLEEDLQLTPHQRALHEGLRQDDTRREVFYASGRGMNRVLSVEIPPSLYWFATTDGEDKYWRGLFVQRFGLRDGVEHLVRACEGRTIAGGQLRIEKVAAYARGLGLVA